MRKPKIGLLPLYVELYDLTTPEVRPDIDAAHQYAFECLGRRGMEVVNEPGPYTDHTCNWVLCLK